MQLRPLLLWGLFLLFSTTCHADRFRVLRSIEEDRKRYETELVGAKNELALVIEKQKTNRNPKFAAELEQMRQELEAALALLAETKRELTERQQAFRATLDVRKPCPICGGKLTKAKNVSHKKHHKNRAVFSYSMCGNDAYVEDSPICTRCWAAQSVGTGIWTQYSTDTRAFVVLLTHAIAAVPKAPVKARDAIWTFRRIQMPDGTRHEMAQLSWNDAPAKYVTALQEYAREHGLEFMDFPNSPFRQISISTPDKAEGPGLPGL